MKGNIEIMDMEIQRIWVLSTGHILQTDLAQLEGELDSASNLVVESTRYGVDVFISERNNLESFSDYFRKIFTLGVEAKVDWIRFDCDGPEVDGLEIFDW